MLAYTSSIVNDGVVIYPLAKSEDIVGTAYPFRTELPEPLESNGVKERVSILHLLEKGTMLPDNGDLPLASMRIVAPKETRDGLIEPVPKFLLSRQAPSSPAQYILSASSVLKRYTGGEINDETFEKVDPYIRQNVVNLLAWWAISVADYLTSLPDGALNKSTLEFAVKTVNNHVTGPLFDFVVDKKLLSASGFFVADATEQGTIRIHKQADGSHSTVMLDSSNTIDMPALGMLVGFSNANMFWRSDLLLSGTPNDGSEGTLRKLCGSTTNVPRNRVVVTRSTTGSVNLEIVRYTVSKRVPPKE
jgi:hypothetical protein